MIKRTIITFACLLMLWIIGLFTIPGGRLQIFLYEFDPEFRAERYKRQDAYDYAREKCQHIDMTEAGDKCWDTAFNDFMSR